MDNNGLNLLSNESQLVNLKKFLNYHLSTFLLFAVSFFSIIPVFILTGAAVVFIPYIILVLYRNGKYGWILTLIFMVILPVIVLVLFVGQTYTLIILLLIELAVFYFYCFTLRIVVNDWVKEMNEVKKIEYQRRRQEQQKNDMPL